MLPLSLKIVSLNIRVVEFEFDITSIIMVKKKSELRELEVYH